MIDLVNTSRSYVLAVALVIGIQGCATHPTTKSCEQLGDIDARLDCFDEAMFGRVTNGVLVGAVGGAILGGAVAFALTRHPGAALVSTAEGAFVGSMVGGIAGGVVAYFEELQQRAGGRQEAMIANHIAYMESDSRKYDVLVRISNESIQREEQFYADIKRQLNEQGADIMRIKESVRKNELIFNERWNKIKRDDVDYKDSKKVRDVVSSKIGIGANPVVAENTAKMSQQINNVYDNIIRRQREREEIYIQYPALRSNG